MVLTGQPTRQIVQPIGSGRSFVEHKPGRADAARKEPGLLWRGPYLDALVIRVILDSSTALQAFRNGEVDSLVFFTPPLAEVPALEQDPAAKVVRYTYLSIYYLGCNLARQPLSDRKVRQALAMGIDRQEIVERASNGLRYTRIALLYASNRLGAEPGGARPGLSDSGERAMRLLDEASFRPDDQGTRMTLVFPYPNLGDDWRNIAQVVQAQLKVLGVAVELVELEAAALAERPRQARGGGGGGDFDPVAARRIARARPGSNLARLRYASTARPIQF